MHLAFPAADWKPKRNLAAFRALDVKRPSRFRLRLDADLAQAHFSVHLRGMTRVSFPGYEPTTPQFLKAITAQHADAPMVVLGDARRTYREAEARSAALSSALLEAGVGKGSHVGLLLPNGPDWIEHWLAVTRIGAIAVPFNTFYQARELGWTLDHADIEFLVTADRFLQHDYLERLEAAVPELAKSDGGPLALASLPFLRRIFVVKSGADDVLPTWCAELEMRDDIDRTRLEAAEARVRPSDAMMILYSSGSTADPKGAVHSHGAVIRHSHNLLATRDLVASDRVWSPMPFFWVGGFVFSLLGCLHAGACVICEEVFEPEATLRLFEREGVTIAAGWPHFGQALANHPSAKERDLSALRAGNLPDLLPPSVVAPDPELRPNALGMTETCGPHTCVSEGPLPESLRGSHGVAVPGVEHKIIDPQSGEPMPPGEDGEICVRGYSLMQRLYKVEREDTFDADGFYHTGDVGHFDENGVLFFKGRLGDMIKTGGANVTPSEVEQVINARAEVARCYVVGVPDPARGQLVVAAVVAEPDREADPEALRAHVKQELAAYKVPRHVFVDAEEALPFTASGKIDKQRLAAQLAARLGC